jgi:subtilisin family serine protease
MSKLISILFFILSIQSLNAQKNFSLDLQYILSIETLQKKSYDLLLKGNSGDLVAALRALDIKVKYTSNEWIAVNLRSNQLESLLGLKEIEELFFDTNKGQLLNDKMLANANVLGLQQIGIYDSLLNGDDVIIGFIDSGMDYSHPDFLNEDGSTRILYYWDQKEPEDSTELFEEYGYGKLLTSDSINSWLDSNYQIIMDPNNWYGHGSTVVGAACSNGSALAEMLATGAMETDFHGVAPKSSIMMIASDFDRPNWLASVADGVHFMLAKAQEENKAIVINLSIGTYSGSHDALDPVGLLINSWFSDDYEGRALVCAGGNSRTLRYHLGYQSSIDTSFSLYSTFNGPPNLGRMASMECWLDSVDIDGFHSAITIYDPMEEAFILADMAYRNITENLDTTLIDTLFASDTIAVGIAKRYMENRGDQIRFQVQVEQITNPIYKIALFSYGNAQVDTWSAGWLGSSDIIGPESLPILISGDENYISPDSLMQTVSSFSCAENVITVANYKNRVTYTDINNTIQDLGGVSGELALHSSRGPTRDGRMKPDISASGELVLSSGPFNYLEILLNAAPHKLAEGGWHMRNGGSSMASPIVAGIAALYLQRCPYAKPSSIKNAILSSGYQDIFTGTLPNESWGFGKVDGAASLYFSLEEIEINESTGVCDESEVYLSIDDEYSSIYWNTGDSTEAICASTGNYFVQALDADGCVQRSDDVFLVPNEVESLEPEGISVYPNPFNAAFTVKGIEFSESIRIVNSLGQEQDVEVNQGADFFTVSMSSAKSGLYFLIDEKSGSHIELILTD